MSIDPSRAASFRPQLSSRPDRRIEVIENAIASLSKETTTNLVHLYDRVQAIEETIRDVGADAYHFEEVLAPYKAQLQQQEKERFRQAEWLRLGLPEKMLALDADGVEFLMQSRFAYLMVAFKNSGFEGEDTEEMGSRLCIKMNGEYVPWKEIKEKLCFDQSQGKVVSCLDKTIAYNYISPLGIVERDPRPGTLYPIGTLSSKDVAALMEHAKCKEDECVLQIGTSQKACVSEHWLVDNCNRLNPTHNFVRLINRNGELYSFGMMATPQMLEAQAKNLFAAGYAGIVTPDFDEYRPFDERTITTVSISTEKMQEILEFAGEINQSGGARFSILNQNCNTFVVCVAAIAGIEIDTRMTAGELLLGLLPDIKKIPLIGSPISAVVERITKSVQPIFTAIDHYTPWPLKQLFSLVTDIALFIPKKIATLFFNTCLFCNGAGHEIEPMKGKRLDKKRFPEFSRVIDSIQDFFADGTSDIHHTKKLTEWQRQQPTTKVHYYDGTPKIHLLP